MSDPRTMIQSRRAAIDARIADIDAAIRPLEEERIRLADELSALRVAERVFSDLSGEPQPAPFDPGPERTARSKRPRGLPTTAIMLSTVLSEAVEASGAGLRSQEIMAEIRRRWWPRVRSNDVLPALHRFVRRGVLFERDGERFRPLRKT